MGLEVSPSRADGSESAGTAVDRVGGTVARSFNAAIDSVPKRINRFGDLIYLACRGPTEGVSKADEALRAWSGMRPDCIPIGSWHHPAFFLSDREHVELRDDAGKKQRTRHHRQQNIENGLVNFMDCVS